MSLTARPAPCGPSWWDTLPLTEGQADGPVALGGSATPDALIGAYRAGVFPWPSEDAQTGWQSHQLALALRAVGRGLVRRPRLGDLPWWCPDPRAVIPAGTVRAARSLRGRIRSCGWTTTVDRAFDEVVTRCRRAAPEIWITDELRAGYAQLHALGWAHSLEVWAADRLVGGAFGILIGGVFVGESMFHDETDASKIAMVDLDARFAAAGGRLLDVQIASDHLRTLGAVEISRDRYLATLRAVRDDDIRLVTDQLPVNRLLPAPGPGRPPPGAAGTGQPPRR
ncbi:MULTISPECIES: leucyl/phenylalanyl-tRNA--protein transferase [unclassified Pseudofrankia]|uniref:leucyl/phenylalanyl-tRNA--protein transferase n=1 Tax=unclassified Pseudofrankia TaxID=2994372 RepID=UPI0008DAF9C0|nr:MULTISPECIES: leucyl/phenylalanyl-tRNA--protein transferase [unclassified Pseudofrankia]MDT3441110.1 leucyl/phenylalanyl-tRNA--protein transferase [Pseudofrankia sp. BMG5.37]OHV54278.1 leucyl/phenylalanyl-tRNA--protein transferase [Pseudofrankia sp. BMG5.36]